MLSAWRPVTRLNLCTSGTIAVSAEMANLTRTDQLTQQLMQNEQSRSCRFIAATLSFRGDARVSQTLMARLASLLESHRHTAAISGGDFIETLTRWRSNVSGKVSCRVLQIIARQ